MVLEESNKSALQFGPYQEPDASSLPRDKRIAQRLKMERLKKILTHPEHTIKQVLRQMDAMGEKTILVVEGDNTLIGTATDGDIRRWILKGRNLNEKITKVMHKDAVTLRRGFTKESANALMLKRSIECIPVVDEEGKVISAVWWVDLFSGASKIYRQLKLPVVIMAGGEGTRLSPFTKILPKPLVPVGEKPIIEVIIGKFLAFGSDDFYLSLNYKSNIIKAYFSDIAHTYNLHYIQETKPLGTAGSLHLLKNKIKETFFVSNCDILIDADYADVLDLHRLKKNKITLVSSMKNFTIPYGVCEIENGGFLKNIREKPEYDFLVNTGMYILEPSVLADIPRNKFYNFTDLIADYLAKNENIGVYPISEKSWLDIGQWEALQDTVERMKVE